MTPGAVPCVQAESSAAAAVGFGRDVLEFLQSKMAHIHSLLPGLEAHVRSARDVVYRFGADVDFHNLGARGARAAAATLSAASSVVCTIRTLLVDSASAGTSFLLSENGRQCMAGLACGTSGAGCLCLAAHPNWSSVQTESVVSCAVSVGCVLTAARHLEVCADVPQRYLVVAGGAVGAALGWVFVAAYRSLQRAKVPLYSFLFVIGGMALLVDGAIIISNS